MRSAAPAAVWVARSTPRSMAMGCRWQSCSPAVSATTVRCWWRSSMTSAYLARALAGLGRHDPG